MLPQPGAFEPETILILLALSSIDRIWHYFILI